MVRKSYMPEQIINKLREAEILLNQLNPKQQWVRQILIAKLPTTCSRGYNAGNSNLVSGILYGVRSTQLDVCGYKNLSPFVSL